MIPEDLVPGLSRKEGERMNETPQERAIREELGGMVFDPWIGKMRRAR